MKKCSFCGRSDTDPAHLFCTHCGNELKEIDDTEKNNREVALIPEQAADIFDWDGLIEIDFEIKVIRFVFRGQILIIRATDTFDLGYFLTIL